MASGRIVGAEALVRWRRESGQMVSPMDFIPVAEESGLIVPIGAWVLREAAAKAREWNTDARRRLSVAVNLSARQFRDPGLVEMVRDILAETGLDPQLLNIEITESTVMHNAEEAIKALHALRATGVSLSVDDFGTGYSSLSYLKRLPLDHLKVDRSFVQDIPGDHDSVAITRAVIDLAHGLELEVVAEGVETEEQREFLLAQGCDYAQGYLFSKPIDAAAFAELIASSGLSCERRQRVSGHPEQAPLVHALGAEAFVKTDRRLVPVEHQPLEAAAAALVRDARDMQQQRLAVTAAPVFGPHEQVLQIQALAAHEGGEIVKVHGEADRLVRHHAQHSLRRALP
jgi:EAL domain-containing protein (putative c-di-GMP-specific phosphodiesterase class I)